jgi:hypothetical protein
MGVSGQFQAPASFTLRYGIPVFTEKEWGLVDRRACLEVSVKRNI